MMKSYKDAGTDGNYNYILSSGESTSFSILTPNCAQMF